MKVSSSARPGFTLIELMVTLFLFGLLAVISVESYNAYRQKNNVYLARTEIISTLHRAANRAIASDGDSAWGLKLGNNQVILFKGASYASRVSGFDETHSLPAQLTLTGSNEIIFSKFTGLPSASTTISLSSSDVLTSIQINSKGFISY